MKLRMTRDYNTPLVFIQAGQVVVVDGDLAAMLLDGGFAEAVNDESTATRTGGTTATKARARKEVR